jgi:hypothetical protein
VASDSPVIDIHVHIQPWETMKPWAHKTISEGRKDTDVIQACMHDPAALVDFLDKERIEKVALINYVAPEIMGFNGPPTTKSARRGA